MKTRFFFGNNTRRFVSLILLLLVLFFPEWVFSQQPAPKPVSGEIAYNMLLWLMVAIILILFVFIIVLSEVIKNAGFFVNEKIKSDGSAPLLILLFLVPSFTEASELANLISAPTELDYGGLPSTLFWGLFVVICFELLVIAVQIIIIRLFIQVSRKANVVEDIVAKPVSAGKVWDRINASVDILDEEAITFEHDYDGIRELDNSLPPWWKYGFYLTILFSFIYLVHYHVTRTGDLSAQEYDAEVARAKAQIEEFMRNSASQVDETNVKLLTEVSEIKLGRDVYQANCAACHGKLGEGSVGPNLTDNYWIHGGSIADIFKTVKYGFAEKGMKAWKDDLSPRQIAEVSSFIKTLVGTNPPNGKEKQGNLWVEPSSNLPGDSTIIVVDTILKISRI